MTFKYPQSTSNDYVGTAFYDDSYFESDSTIYNSSLSTCSIAFAMSSFASNTDKENSAHRYINGENFLKDNGFNQIDVNGYYKIKSTSDSLGVIFANKKIGDTTLIAIGTRGGNYEMEWASNVTLGDGKEIKQHLGFYQGSSIILDSLLEYINEYSITGECKLWSVGYSRGGACNNLAIGRIDQAIYKNETLFEGKISLKKENIYCYCFEDPMGASFNEDISPRDNIYSNIHNIVNPNDPVTKVAMNPRTSESGFRFTRYGVDYYLPDSVRNNNYTSIINKVINFYNDMDNHSSIGDYRISNFSMAGNTSSDSNLVDITSSKNTRINWTSGLFLDEFISYLTLFGVGNLDNYVTNFQDGLRELFKIVYKNGSPKFSFMTLGASFTKYLLNSSNVDILINNLFHDPSTFINDFIVLLNRVLVDLGLDISPTSLFGSIKSLIGAVTSVFIYGYEIFFTFLNLDNVYAIISGHYPELCFAHLMSQDKNYNSSIEEYNSDGSYYYLEIPEVDSQSYVEIENENGECIGLLQDGCLLSETNISYGCKDKVFFAYIPVEKSYSITIKNAYKYNLYYFDQTQEDLVNYKSEEIENEVSFTTQTYPEKSNK